MCLPVQSLKRLIEATLKFKKLNSTLDCYFHLPLQKPRDWCRKPYYRDAFYIIMEEAFSVKCCSVVSKIYTFTQVELCFVRPTHCFCETKHLFEDDDDEHVLKRKSQIVYVLWLPTILWVCPRDAQLHQTGETNRISNRLSAPAV